MVEQQIETPKVEIAIRCESCYVCLDKDDKTPCIQMDISNLFGSPYGTHFRRFWHCNNETCRAGAVKSIEYLLYRRSHHKDYKPRRSDGVACKGVNKECVQNLLKPIMGCPVNIMCPNCSKGHIEFVKDYGDTIHAPMTCSRCDWKGCSCEVIS